MAAVPVLATGYQALQASVLLHIPNSVAGIVGNAPTFRGFQSRTHLSESNSDTGQALAPILAPKLLTSCEVSRIQLLLRPKLSVLRLSQRRRFS